MGYIAHAWVTTIIAEAYHFLSTSQKAKSKSFIGTLY